ncbi:MAG: Holliday junction resolvase RuvX [Saprospiraceae bacterium]
MGRIMGIDYGLKRTGIAVTDPLQIIVQGLDTRKTEDLLSFLTEYCKNEKVDQIVVGYPFYDGKWGEPKFQRAIESFIQELKKKFPGIDIQTHDERYSSMRAREIIHQRGMSKKKSQDKELLDKTSAIIILQEYLGHI